jgi:cytochrome oxidase Cu insertion factor (SCO1/SenC/PrrC family)
MGKSTVLRPRRDPRRTRWSRWSRLWVAGLVGLLVVGGASYLDWRSGLIGAAAREGDPAPPFVLRDSEGRQVSLADYLGQRPILLVFYMTYG